MGQAVSPLWSYFPPSRLTPISFYQVNQRRQGFYGLLNLGRKGNLLGARKGTLVQFCTCHFLLGWWTLWEMIEHVYLTDIFSKLNTMLTSSPAHAEGSSCAASASITIRKYPEISSFQVKERSPRGRSMIGPWPHS